MITSINSNNSLDYNARFADASKSLKIYILDLLEKKDVASLKKFLLKSFPDIHEDLGIDKDEFNGLVSFTEAQTAKIKEKIDSIIISTLNNYFCYIKDLAEIRDSEQYLSKYVVLPLDEEPFVIDANARTITVPATFKKNGIGVQGDEGAEMLHFIIDRYVDNIDLASQDIYIVIQYEAPNGSGIDRVAFKDVESKPNKVIFGWSLDKDIMAIPGNVKFAVHFLKGEPDSNGYLTNVTYRLSTLMAQVSINKSLEFKDIEFNVNQNPSQLIKDRLVDTENQEAPGAAEPEFIINLTSLYQDKTTPNLYYVDINGEVHTFETLAYSKDAGFVSYEWKKENNVLENNEGYFVYTAIEPAEQAKPITGKSYYYEYEKDKYAYISAAEMAKDTSGTTYYDRRNRYDLTEDFVGLYSVKAINRTGTKTNDKDSNYIRIPGPVDPVIKEEMGEGEYKRAFIADKPKLIINAEAGMIPYEGAEKDDLIYYWEKVGETEDQKINVIPVDLGKVDIDDANEAVYMPEEAGWYTVRVEAQRNGAKKPIASNVYYRVTEEPSELTIDDEYSYTPVIVTEESFIPGLYYVNENGKFVIAEVYKEEETKYYLRGEVLKIQEIDVLKNENINIIVNTENKNCDSYRIEWYEDSEIYGEANTNDILLDFDGLEITAAQLKEAALEGAYLYCRIINTFNDKEVKGPISRLFRVTRSGVEE